MSYLIFLKNLNNIQGTLYRIAENESDFNNLNIFKEDYKIIQESENNFNAIKYGEKYCNGYNGDIPIYINTVSLNFDKNTLTQYINTLKNAINDFLTSNKNHVEFQKWNNYLNQLNNLNLETITYPLTKSLEKYFYDLGQPSYNILQLP